MCSPLNSRSQDSGAELMAGTCVPYHQPMQPYLQSWPFSACAHTGICRKSFICVSAQDEGAKPCTASGPSRNSVLRVPEGKAFLLGCFYLTPLEEINDLLIFLLLLFFMLIILKTKNLICLLIIYFGSCIGLFFFNIKELYHSK